MKLSKLNPNERNPRRISQEKLTALEKSVEEFGDMAGIIYNRRTKRLVGGHQRSKILKDAEIKIDRKQKADAQGTVATGYAVVRGQRYSYREVEWDERKETAAMIAANQHGGEWTDGLADLLKELDADGIALAGFDESELAEIMARIEIPDANKAIDEGALAETNCECPKCGFKWQQ